MTDTPPDSPSVPEDGILPPADLPIRLDVFEGPLDLLLFLIRKNEIDIYDIPIEKVTQQYLEILRTQEKDNLELAGDFFLVCGATKLGFEFDCRAIEHFGFVANRTRNPVLGAQFVENGSSYAKFGIGLKFIIPGRIVLFHGIHQSDHT